MKGPIRKQKESPTSRVPSVYPDKENLSSSCPISFLPSPAAQVTSPFLELPNTSPLPDPASPAIHSHTLMFLKKTTDREPTKSDQQSSKVPSLCTKPPNLCMQPPVPTPPSTQFKIPKKTTTRPDSRKRPREEKKQAGVPPGLKSLKKRRLTKGSLWWNKYDRQRHLYGGTDVNWVGAEVRLGGSQWIPNCIESYKRLKQIGSGVYGSVYRGEAPSGKPVALKFLRLENERDGLPITAVREINLLKRMDHPNVIKLMDMVTTERMGKDSRRRADIYMVLEWCDHDLAGLMLNPNFEFTEPVIKHFMIQIMEGFKYLHSTMGTLHRDVKPANILVTRDGGIKLADFGLARVHEKTKALTNGMRIVTRWYRSPELLLGSQKYDYSIDMWSVGCVFGELITNKPIFPARQEIHQLGVIMDVCGSFDPTEYPDIVNFTGVPKSKQKRRIRAHFRGLLDEKEPKWHPANIETALDMLDRLLAYNPKKRLTAAEGCKHSYFSTSPQAKKPRLPSDSHHEWKYNKRLPSHRRQTKPRPQQEHSKPHHRNNHHHLHHHVNHHPHHRSNDWKNDFEQRFKPQRKKKVHHRGNNHRKRQPQQQYKKQPYIDYGF